MIPVVIVGLGRIGAGNVGFAGQAPLNHLAAVRSVPDLKITGLVDAKPQAREALKSAGLAPDQVPIVADLAEVPTANGEIIALCTPAETHVSLFEKALLRKPRVVIFEKPFAPSLADARRLVAMAEAAGTTIRVNFHRRFDSRHRRWRAELPAAPAAIVARYSKGLMNYGSHLIDLLLHWYGPIEFIQALGTADASIADASMSFHCRMTAGFGVTAIGLDGLDYDLFEIDIYDHAGRIEFSAGGADIRRYAPVEGLHYKGYRHLAEIAGKRDSGPVGGFAELYAAVAHHVIDGAPLAGCDGYTALAGLAAIEAVQRSAAGGGKIVYPEIRLAQAA